MDNLRWMAVLIHLNRDDAQYSGIDQVGHRGRHELMYFKYTTLQPYTDCGTDAYNITVKLIGASDAT